MVLAVALRAATSISTGWFRYERPSLRISLLKVAENRGPELRGQQADDALQVGQEAHVQHAISLVQHQDADLTQVHVLLFHVIQQAARRGDQDFAATAQRFALRTDVHAAEHHGRTQRRLLAVALDAFVHLVRQFARGREDQRAHRVRAGEALALASGIRRCRMGTVNAAVLPVPV